MDINSIPAARGFVYPAVVIDWHRRVLTWRLSISMDTAFCTGVVEDGDRQVRQTGDLQHRPGPSTWVQGIVATSTSATRAGRMRAIELEPRTGCASHRCLSLGPKQRDHVASTCKSSKSVQIIGASSWQRCGRTRPQDERVAVVTFVSLRSGAVWHRLWGIALFHLSR